MTAEQKKSLKKWLRSLTPEEKIEMSVWVLQQLVRKLKLNHLVAED